jgi:thiol-disulfide isomerase/thioredoxin
MMKNRCAVRPLSFVVLVALVAPWVAPVARAQEEGSGHGQVTLKVGDMAPPLRVGKWMKGEPVTELERGKIYVIEFWATWCGPCVTSIPRVTKLQEKFRDKGVVVIGVDVLEPDAERGPAFVTRMGDRMGYRVAADDVPEGGRPEQGKMVTTWWRAAGQAGVPYAFLVDRDGRLAWHGHPLQMEHALGMLAEDKFDAAEQAKWDKRLEGQFVAFNAAAKARDFDKALAALDEIAAMAPGMADMMTGTRMDVLLIRRDYKAANALAAALAADEAAAHDAFRLATTANALLNAADPEQADRATALKLAAKAYEAEGRTGWQYESLLARAHAANGQFDKAAEVQAKAVENAPEAHKEGQAQVLAAYKARAAAK